jgi:hypothetical protein
MRDISTRTGGDPACGFLLENVQLIAKQSLYCRIEIYDGTRQMVLDGRSCLHRDSVFP